MRTESGQAQETEGPPGRQFADGVSQSGREPNRLFLSQEGRDFVDVSGVSGADHDGDGRAFAQLDFDRDGWLDLAVVGANEPLLQLFRNELGGRGTPGNSIAIRFEGANRSAQAAPGKSPRDGYGARVEIDLDDGMLTREHRAGEGLAAQNAARLLVGIGARDAARSVVVHWPSGTVQRFEHVKAGTELVAVEDESGSRSVYPGQVAPELHTSSPRQGDRLLPDLESSSSLRVLTTLATWCDACREELPELRVLREAFGAEELALYGVPVDLDDTRSGLERWARESRPPYEVLVDLTPAERVAVRSFAERALRRDGLPASVITDGSGRVLRTLFGAPTVSDLRALRSGR